MYLTNNLLLTFFILIKNHPFLELWFLTLPSKILWVSGLYKYFFNDSYFYNKIYLQIHWKGTVFWKLVITIGKSKDGNSKIFYPFYNSDEHPNQNLSYLRIKIVHMIEYFFEKVNNFVPLPITYFCQFSIFRFTTVKIYFYFYFNFWTKI